jgi:CheY-like chemotaxis protein
MPPLRRPGRLRNRPRRKRDETQDLGHRRRAAGGRHGGDDLNRNGYDAIALYSSGSALEESQNGCPDILLSDVMMPKINGIDTAIAITRRCPRTRVLLFSGQAATANLLREAEEQGFRFELLLKPLRPEVLLGRLSAN